jgi:MSHA biogenesis protein MshP
MYPDHPDIGMQSVRVAMQRGFSIVSGIFLLVIMASLGTFMLMFSTVQQTTSAQDLQGSRAYQAARTGIEWGLYQVLQPAAAPACPATTLSGLGGALTGFDVDVTCVSVNYVEAGNPVRIYQIRSNGHTAGVAVGTRQYVERELQVTVSR